jgi:hypothetical protein
MSGSSTAWRGRRSGSKRSVRVIPRPVRTPAPVALTAVPDPRRRLSDAVLVEASVRARVMGIRLLSLDATVVLVPADLTASPPAVFDPPAQAPARPSAVPRARSRAAGRGLAEAVRSIDEGAEILSRTQRDGR